MTTRRLVLVFAIEALWLAAVTLGLADREAHRHDPQYGINQWGYRDRARARKDPGEIRIALVGGSAAFEAGTGAGDTLATQILFTLQELDRPLMRTESVVNLSQPRVGADSYTGTLRQYRYLEPDAIVFFDGYDTLEGLPPHAREQSTVFRTTGYLPLLPARLLGRPGWLSDGDGGVAAILRDDRTDDVSCAGASRSYCDAMTAAVRTALQQSQAVIVAPPPFVTTRHQRQQLSLAERLQTEFGGNARFQYVDAGRRVDLSQKTQSPDGVQRTITANHTIGLEIGKTAVALLGRAR